MAHHQKGPGVNMHRVITQGSENGHPKLTSAPEIPGHKQPSSQREGDALATNGLGGRA